MLNVEDIDYYTKVCLLSKIHGPSPVSSVTGLGDVFLGPSSIESLRTREKILFAKDLPLADGIALLMIARPEGNVAAVSITYPRLGTAKIVIAKNKTSSEDELHAHKLMGLCTGNMTDRHQDFIIFSARALRFIIPFCEGKIMKRLKAIRVDHLDTIANEMESTTPLYWDRHNQGDNPCDLSELIERLEVSNSKHLRRARRRQ